MDLHQITVGDMVLALVGRELVLETDVSDQALEDSVQTTFILELPDYGEDFRAIFEQKLIGGFGRPVSSFQSPAGDRVRFLFSYSQFRSESGMDAGFSCTDAWHIHLLREAARYLETLVPAARKEDAEQRF